MKIATIAAATVAAILATTAAQAGAYATKTRYGVLDGFGILNPVANALTFRGQPVQPPVEGISGLTPAHEVTRIGDKDILLIQDTGDEACPAQFLFATVTAAGVKVSSEFGGCDYIIRSYEVIDGKIRLTMPSWRHEGRTETYVFDPDSGKVGLPRGK